MSLAAQETLEQKIAARLTEVARSIGIENFDPASVAVKPLGGTNELCVHIAGANGHRIMGALSAYANVGATRNGEFRASDMADDSGVTINFGTEPQMERYLANVARGLGKAERQPG